MNTQMVFRIDKKLKLAAQKRAKEKGITLSELYQHTTRSFVDGGLDLTKNVVEIPNAKTARSLDRALRDVKLGRNFSPSFDNAKDAIAYLKKYAS